MNYKVITVLLAMMVGAAFSQKELRLGINTSLISPNTAVKGLDARGASISDDFLLQPMGGAFTGYNVEYKFLPKIGLSVGFNTGVKYYYIKSEIVSSITPANFWELPLSLNYNQPIGQSKNYTIAGIN